MCSLLPRLMISAGKPALRPGWASLTCVQKPAHIQRREGDACILYSSRKSFKLYTSIVHFLTPSVQLQGEGTLLCGATNEISTFHF